MPIDITKVKNNSVQSRIIFNCIHGNHVIAGKTIHTENYDSRQGTSIHAHVSMKDPNDLSITVNYHSDYVSQHNTRDVLHSKCLYTTQCALEWKWKACEVVDHSPLPSRRTQAPGSMLL